VKGIAADGISVIQIHESWDGQVVFHLHFPHPARSGVQLAAQGGAIASEEKLEPAAEKIRAALGRMRFSIPKPFSAPPSCSIAF